MDRATARGRRRSRSLVIVLLALAVVAVFGIAAQQALAFQTFEHGTATTCTVCHTVSTSTPPTNAACAASACHTGYNVPRAGKTCWTCHDPGQDMSAVPTGAPTSCTTTCHLAGSQAAVPGSGHNPHPERGLCTTCHNTTTSFNTPNGSPHHTLQVPDPTTVTLKVAPTTIKLKKTVKATGVVTPADLGGVVNLTAKFKSGSKWKNVKTAKATVSATGTYSWTYKPGKKGSYRIQAASSRRPTTSRVPRLRTEPSR